MVKCFEAKAAAGRYSQKRCWSLLLCGALWHLATCLCSHCCCWALQPEAFWLWPRYDTVCDILRSQSRCWALQARLLLVAAWVLGRAHSLCFVASCHLSLHAFLLAGSSHLGLSPVRFGPDYPVVAAGVRAAAAVYIAHQRRALFKAVPLGSGVQRHAHMPACAATCSVYPQAHARHACSDVVARFRASMQIM